MDEIQRASATPPADEATLAEPYAPPASVSHAAQPKLLRDPSFWAMAVTQFLGAFNDNLFKQILLLLAVGAAVQGEAQAIFAAAFLLFSGVAGWLADRTSKRKLIIYSKMAEIVVMVAGMIGFMYYPSVGLAGMLVVLFFMGLQSAFFGPPKYGILPETIRESDLPRANGIFLMFTFVAIIAGVALAGIVKERLAAANLWQASIICVAIAVLGTITSFGVWKVPAAMPNAKLRRQDLFIPGEMIRLIRSNREILLALLVSSVFWMLGGVVQTTVNALGVDQLKVGDDWTSLLAAMMAVGIPVGCVLGGYLSAGSINPRIVGVGAYGMFICLVLLSLPGGPKQHLLGYWGSVPVLVALGFFTGMFVVPIQVSLQVLPPPDDKGRMIATMNQANFAGILLGGVLFSFATTLLAAWKLPVNLMFGVTAAIMLPLAITYRPKERKLHDD